MRLIAFIPTSWLRIAADQMPRRWVGLRVAVAHEVWAREIRDLVTEEARSEWFI